MQKTFVICLSSGGHPASLELRKLYELKRDARAEKLGLLRVVDESGEDYLYPAKLFERMPLSQQLRRKIASVHTPA